jgi:hypothetical protein
MTTGSRRQRNREQKTMRMTKKMSNQLPSASDSQADENL